MAKKAESGGYARLKGDLAQKTPGSFYVLYGEEDYLRRYYLSMLRRQLVDGPTEDFNFHRLTSENFSMAGPLGEPRGPADDGGAHDDPGRRRRSVRPAGG